MTKIGNHRVGKIFVGARETFAGVVGFIAVGTAKIAFARHLDHDNLGTRAQNIGPAEGKDGEQTKTCFFAVALGGDSSKSPKRRRTVNPAATSARSISASKYCRYP